MVVGVCQSQTSQLCLVSSSAEQLTASVRLVSFSVPLLVHAGVRSDLHRTRISLEPLSDLTPAHLSLVAIRLSLSLALTALQAAIALRSNAHEVSNLDVLDLRSDADSTAYDLVSYDLCRRSAQPRGNGERKYLGVIYFEPSAREGVEVAGADTGINNLDVDVLRARRVSKVRRGVEGARTVSSHFLGS